MRILFLHHFPLRHSEAGHWVQRWVGALAAAGHEARCLVVDGNAEDSEPFHAARVSCRPGDPTADLPFEMPCFRTPPPPNARKSCLSNCT